MKKSMKIGIDVTSLHIFSKDRGIGFYAQNLFDSIKKYTAEEVTLIKEKSQKEDLDLIHYPTFDFFRKTLNIDRNLKNVITIHDVIPLIYPKRYPAGIRGKINLRSQKKELDKINAIITDSGSSKKDIIEYLKISEDKVFVVPLAPAENFKKIKDSEKINEVKKRYKLPEKFVLYVGDINYNKNIINSINASVISGLPLVICGKQAALIEEILRNNSIKGPRDLVRSLLDKPHPEIAHLQEVIKLIKKHNVLRLGFVPIDDLAVVYNLASVFLMPSFYEGFGLPILEAQACGCPVITSNISSMPEVAGKGAIFVNPQNVGEILEAIGKITNSQKTAEELIQEGLNNVKRFSWEKTAQETVQIYRQAVT